MKKSYIPSLLVCSSMIMAFFACQEDTSKLGSSLTTGEISITIDTTIYNLHARAISLDTFDSKTGNLLIGRVESPEYGTLDCSFVTRLMCSPNLQIADSLLLPERVDSCKLIMGVGRDEITGDSLSPQKLAVYLLNKQLPSSIDNTFDPEGYYEPSSPLGTKSYTVSNISSSDSVFFKQQYIELSVDLKKEFGQEIFNKYKTDPSVFQWPQTMAEKFIPGLYVKPVFGNGCLANIYQLYLAVYYYTKELKTTINDKDTVTTLENVARVAVPFSVSPEVLSSNKISYKPSEKIVKLNNIEDNGEIVLTTPGGYIASFDFPAQEVIDKYKNKNSNLGRVNDLLLYIPADTLATSSDISLVTNILLVKKSEYNSFFDKNKIPDNSTSFTGTYNSTTGNYVFSSMRNYIMDLIDKDTISKEDVEFILIPVEITSESVSNSYYGSSTSYVTKCVPFTQRPSLTALKTSEAMIVFSFSNQLIE
ncbi:MAG: DUF4270 domain-containing protein [Muribaculaceae bacterium]|nr:DUF4270 domain-containing protein [Muribaculaceae bacterium]